uniref:Uncharacterized protein n=1 Tax=Anopheles epiroticus TaxID=199890 RepID=A0A182PJA4_9DIPT
MENVSLVESIFEAVCVGDLELLEGCIVQATLATALQFERMYGESPLHLCVKIGGLSHVPLVRCLLASGLFDAACLDEDGKTMLEAAYEGGDGELLEALIRATIEGLDDATACYIMLRHGSPDIYRAFLAIKQYREEEEFCHIANAFIQLNVKNGVLPEGLQMFLLWKLSDYGFRKLSGNWPGTKDPNDWKHHIAIVQDCWRVIAEHHDTRLFADVDDQFLYRLHTLHNHLYFLKHKQFLAYLPLQETIFCVAIFLSIYRNSAQFREYRLMVNKCQVIEFVRMAYRQLTRVKAVLERTELDLLEIVREMEAQDATAKGVIVQELLTKLESSKFPNKEHVVRQFRERATAIGSSSKDSLIKDMMDRVKRIDKVWMEKTNDKLKAFEKTSRAQLIEQIGKRLRHVAHPQNVANRLMGDWRKGKATDEIVAEIIAGEVFELGHLLQQNDRRTSRRLVKCYVRTRQHYSLHKIVYYCEQMAATTSSSGPTEPCTFADIACMKRTVQVLGEAIKNTINSANLPGKAQDAVNSMLTALFPDMNKQLREVFSHSISLKKLLVGDANDRRLCGTFRSYLDTVRIAFQLLYAVAVADIRHSFYGAMRRCNTLEQLRSLAVYVGNNEDLEERQLECYRQVRTYFDEVKATFASLEREPIGQMPQFRHLQSQLEVKRSIVCELGKHFTENEGFSFAELRKACFTSDSLDAVRRLLDWKLTMSWANKFFKKVRSSWHSNHVESLAIEWMDVRLLRHNPSLIAGVLKNGSVSMDCAEAFDYLDHTRTLAEALNAPATVMDDEELLEQLNKRLKPYYNNIFFVDNKWKVLEAFWKERKLPWNKDLCRKLVKHDQAYLQQLYEERCHHLRSILAKSGLQTVDGLTKRIFQLPTRDLVAIEYIQLELCEMLYAVGYFGDSFHYLKHRIPMIQGKNYRNFLAHDALSYNLLTDSSMEKIVINAFILAYTEVRLFGGDKAAAPQLMISFPCVEETNEWVSAQKRLLETFHAGDIERMQTINRTGGEIKLGRFCCSRSPANLGSDLFSLSGLVNPCRVDRSLLEYLKRYFNGFLDKCNDRAFQLAMALKWRDFQAAFDRSIALGHHTIREELFEWPDLMEHVRKTDLFVHLTTVVNRGNILTKLIEYGNERGVRELLPYFDHFRVTDDRGPLGDAMLYCARSIVDLLLPRTAIVSHPAVVLLAIILHWHDIFTAAMDNSDIDAKLYKFLLKTVAQARNYTAGVYLLETPTYTALIPAAFEQGCLAAVRHGEVNLLKHLLARCQPHDRPSLANILHEAALRKRWHCVKVLLAQEHAPVDVFFPGGGDLREESCTLLVLVKYGQHRVLRQVAAPIKPDTVRQFGTPQAPHPLTVAVRNGTASERMVRTLQRLGFDWLDSSGTLHEAIGSKNGSILATILSRVSEVCALQPATCHDHFPLALGVLYRWKMISFVEESKTYDSSLFCAVRNKDKAMVEELLAWGRKARTMPEGTGVLGGIVFRRDTHYICSGKRNTADGHWNTGDSCEEMIVRMETCTLLGEMKWQQFTVNAPPDTPVRFCVLIGENEKLKPLPVELSFTLNEPNSLLECLKDLQLFASINLANYEIIFASFATPDGRQHHFWQIEETCCVYDILPPRSNDPIDLTDTVNYRDMRGETPLHHCFPNDTLEMVQLLVENGANPLLVDKSGMAAMHVALLNSQQHAVGRYLFDECVRRNLRNEQGCTVLELDDGNGHNRLIHTAVMVGRRDIIARLLAHGADVSVVNSFGATAALLAAGACPYQVHRVVQMLLEQDASTIDMIDGNNNTLLHYAARQNSPELLRVVLKYRPNLLPPTDGSLSALGTAILMKHVEIAKSMLAHAVECNVHGLTRIGEEDLVVLSLICNDQELSRALLEYELQHTLAEVDERDLPRLRTVLECKLPGMEELSVARIIQVQDYTQSQSFLEELLGLVLSLTDK